MNDYAINHRASRPLLDGAALDTAIDEVRAALAALLRATGGGEPSRLTEARALLGTLLDRRVALAAARGPGGPLGPLGRPARPVSGHPRLTRRERASRWGWGRGARPRTPARAG